MTFTIEKLKESEVDTALSLYRRIVDELQTGKPEDRRYFKDMYQSDVIKERIKDKNGIYLVGKEDGKVIAFLFGRVSDEVGDIHWMGVSPDYRRKGYGSKLIDKVVHIFLDKGCYETKLFIYPSDKAAYSLFQKHGYREMAFIDQEFFGISIILMVRKLMTVPEERRSRKIILAGEAGQGIKLMAHVLGSILAKLGKEVALNLVYDAAVRGGNIRAEIVYSDEPITVPFFEEADIGLQLSKMPDPSMRAKFVLIESSACEEECRECELRCPASNRIPFEKMATEQFNSPIFVNMIALGKLLSKIGINIEKVNFEAEFPSRFFDENVRAVRYGYTYKD